MMQSKVCGRDHVRQMALLSSNSSDWSKSSISSGSSKLNTSNITTTTKSTSSPPISIRRVKKKIKEADGTISSRSSTRSSIVFGALTVNNVSESCSRQLKLCENNYKTVARRQEGISSSHCLAQPQTSKTNLQGAGAANLTKQSSTATTEQAAQLQGRQAAKKGSGDCQRESPYAALKADTFRNARSGKRPARNRRQKQKENKRKSKEMMLCPNLGTGRSHEKLLQEVSPKLLRTSQMLNCQLRELCRRLCFMRYNVPQLTAPSLVHFHGILEEISRMLMADFSSFQTKLVLPNRLSAN